MSAGLAVLAGIFAIVSGINDGGALLGTGLKVCSVRPGAALLVLVGAVATVPLVTSQVAATFTTRLAALPGPSGQLAMTVAVVCALVVVWTLSSRGRPTSLTLAIVGGLTGAAVGLDLPVSPTAVLLVLVAGVAAPIAGGAMAVAAGRLVAVLGRAHMLPRLHWGAFALQCLAYAANDGQKMLAVFIVALGVTGAPPLICLLTAALFAIGAIYGLPRAGRTLSRELLAARPLHAVAAELGSGLSVIGCAAAGAPVSMTQAIAGGLIGAGMADSVRRVRWAATVKILLAWTVTLPVSVVLALAAALIIKGVGV
ncbi:inorganic phosphate transporter, PiT family [Nonomuraea maritima]|uniref:Inorganic phosphate transporter, PiT family n=1 Tax=Nonomuraea maritima TaxID=683260 RepID=A0A1G9SJ02_9ACTN|nr:inorganic phosphate transporter [Nonomuraea maritima]SDM35466.1 inorganic phosphate transporter, PiT family [Nonomuraea maritima]